ncbi:unnamed protein product [Periconia digitata]|uniref:Uncharacterized protein n=1 Tax=Periconia digitata TaxID=1303443 RepID=A0A9W4UT50_9PLEO|nr:unnamed protein product [Periconia digitata]
MKEGRKEDSHKQTTHSKKLTSVQRPINNKKRCHASLLFLSPFSALHTDVHTYVCTQTLASHFSYRSIGIRNGLKHTVSPLPANLFIRDLCRCCCFVFLTHFTPLFVQCPAFLVYAYGLDVGEVVGNLGT